MVSSKEKAAAMERGSSDPSRSAIPVTTGLAKRSTKGNWTKEEDEILAEVVPQYEPKKWSRIAQALPGKTGKQCRERWLNQLNPTINKAAWTREEELELIHAHDIHGNKWAELTKCLPGRTANSVKNHWNSSVKKKIGLYAAMGLLSQFPHHLPNPANGSTTGQDMDSSEKNEAPRSPCTEMPISVSDLLTPGKGGEYSPFGIRQLLIMSSISCADISPWGQTSSGLQDKRGGGSPCNFLEFGSLDDLFLVSDNTTKEDAPPPPPPPPAPRRSGLSNDDKENRTPIKTINDKPSSSNTNDCNNALRTPCGLLIVNDSTNTPKSAFFTPSGVLLERNPNVMNSPNASFEMSNGVVLLKDRRKFTPKVGMPDLAKPDSVPPGSKMLNLFEQTPGAQRGIESPSAWKSPCFMSGIQDMGFGFDPLVLMREETSQKGLTGARALNFDP